MRPVSLHMGDRNLHMRAGFSVFNVFNHLTRATCRTWKRAVSSASSSTTRGESTGASWCSSSDYEKSPHLRRFPSAVHDYCLRRIRRRIASQRGCCSGENVGAQCATTDAACGIPRNAAIRSRKRSLEQARGDARTRRKATRTKRSTLKLSARRAGKRPKSMFCKRCSQRRQKHPPRRCASKLA